MRVAFVVSDLTYPPREGLHQQTLLTAQIQANRGDEVHLFGFCKIRGDLDLNRMSGETGLRFESPPIVSRLPSVVLGLMNRFVPTAFRSRAIRNLITTAWREHDIVHLENIAACGLVRRGTSNRTILGLIDPGTLRARRMAVAAKSLRFKLKALFGVWLHGLLERSIAFPGIRMQVVSCADANYLRARLPQVRVEAIPVLVPLILDRIRPLEVHDRTREVGLIFMDLRQPHLRDSFLWFIRSVYRPLSSRRRTFDLMVLGRIDQDSELATCCQGLPVTFLPWVDDYCALLASADFIITPDLVGTGLKNRVIQGMALAKPVVGTPTAFEGIPAQNGVHALIAADADEMITALISICDQPQLRRSLGEKARELAMKEFGSESLQDRWRALYDSEEDTALLTR